MKYSWQRQVGLDWQRSSLSGQYTTHYAQMVLMLLSAKSVLWGVQLTNRL